MAVLAMRRFRAGGAEAGFAGRVLRAGLAAFFFRDSKGDIAILLRPLGDDRPACRTGRLLSAECVRFPPLDGPDRVASAIAGRLLEDEERIAAAIATAHQGSILARAMPPGPGALACVPVDLPGAEGVCVRIGARGVFPIDILSWSVEVRARGPEGVVAWPPPSTDEGPLPPDVQSAVLSLVAAFLSGEDPPSFEQEVRSPEESRRAMLNLRLADAAANDAALEAFGAAFKDGSGLNVVLDLTSTCALRCLFCRPNRRTPSEAGDRAELQRLLPALDSLRRRAAAFSFTLAGDDPLASQELFDILALLKEARPSGVAAITPGTALSDPAFVERLAAAGVTSVTLTVLGPDDATHDRLARRRGARREVEAAIRACRAAGIAVHLATVVVRQNLHLLEATLRSVAWTGLRVEVAVFFTEHPDRKLTRRCAPRYAELGRVIEAARPAIEERVGSILYAPLCILPAFARPMAEPIRPAGRKAPDPCRRCACRDACCWVGPEYLALYGAAELRPLDRD